MLLETGSHAQLADGAVKATMGHTTVLVTAVRSRQPQVETQNFVPLTVDYRQKYAAAGRIPPNFLKREMGLSEQEILTGRIIDRSLRPLFPTGYRDETQLTCSLWSVDGTYTPDVVSINAASAALAVSPIPWNGPVGAVRIGLCDDEYIVNPTRRELQHSTLDLVVAAGEKKGLVMLEGGCQNIHLPKLQRAIKTGVKECQAVVQAIQRLASSAGKPKVDYQRHVIPEDIVRAVQARCEEHITAIFSDYSHHKLSRDEAVTALRREARSDLAHDFPGQETNVEAAFQELSKAVFRRLILDNGIRCDGRSCHDLRPIRCRSDVLPALHGSAVFRRGQTEVQCTVAYDSLHANSPMNPLLQATGGAKSRNFLLHYTFPSFATNEVGRGGPPSRREVGHGALAERALRPLLPKDLPLTVLLTATVLESNGSSSMGTVCGGSMALYDAGVNLTAPAAGVAMGLITDTDAEGNITRHRVLTDLLGIEDYLGDMDFKIAGTRTGITAVQADIKLPGLPLSIVMEALLSATDPRVKLLRLMEKEISRPRQEKETWPVVTTLDVPASRRARLVGPGGTTLRSLQAETGVEIWWEDATKIAMFAPNRVAHEEVMETLNKLVEDKEPTLEFGSIYSAQVMELRPTGVMVQLYEGMTPALLHNSQLDARRVQHPSALGIEVGQSIKVKYFGRDETSGQMRLSRRAIQMVSLVPRNLMRKVEEVTTADSNEAAEPEKETPADQDTDTTADEPSTNTSYRD